MPDYFQTLSLSGGGFPFVSAGFAQVLEILEIA